jgi:superfamily I DNA/RNA helicase
MTWVRIFGPPGTGKTYTLNQIFGHITGRTLPSKYIHAIGLNIPYDGYPASQVIFMSYTNTAVDEFLERVGLVRDYRRGFWSTMHGIAMSVLIRAKKLDRYIVGRTLIGGGVSRWQKKFCIEHDIPYDETGELNLKGNQFFTALTYMINRYYPVLGDLHRVFDYLYSFDPEFPFLAEEWQKFKRKNNIIDFNDVLIMAYEYEINVPGKVLISDEFQDFGYLQYEIFMQWAQDKDFVIIAGDDDQAVAFHNGADPRFLLKFGADETVVLDRSKRIPRKVHALSVKYIRTYVKERYDKRFLPRDYEGFVAIRQAPIDDVVRIARKIASDGLKVLILARTNVDVRKIEDLLISYRIPHYRFKRHTVWSEFIDPLMGVVTAIKERKVPDPSLLSLYLRMSGMAPEKVARIIEAVKNDRGGIYTMGLLKKLDRDPRQILKKQAVAEIVGSEDKALLVIDTLSRVYSGQFTKLPGKIFVETIHSSKGREGDLVIVLDGITTKIQNEVAMGRRQFENEVRVWYVAMTRAKRGLIIVPWDSPFLIPQLKKMLRWSS